MLEKRYTVTEAARISGFSRSKVLNLIKAGKLVAINTSSGTIARYEILEDSLYDFLNPVRKRRTDWTVKRPTED